MGSVIIFADSHSSLNKNSYSLSGFCFSTNNCSTSGPVFVTPQATSSLCPNIMPGTPAKITPATFISLDCNLISYQIDGVVSPKCGSSARSGLREAVLSPSTTQLLLPLNSSGRTTSSKLEAKIGREHV